jgi:hypothetical protein
MGYGMQFEPRPHGPIVTKVFGGGEAHRTGLIQEGDVLTEVNGASISEDALGPPTNTLVSLSTGGVRYVQEFGIASAACCFISTAFAWRSVVACCGISFLTRLARPQVGCLLWR